MIRFFKLIGVLFFAGCSVSSGPVAAGTASAIAPPMPEAMPTVTTPPRVTKIGQLGNCVIYTNNVLHFCGTSCPVAPMTNFTFQFFQNPIPATSQTQMLTKTLKGTTNFHDWYIVASNVGWRSTVIVPNNKPCEFFRLE
jgi:hypothetical protein